TLVAVGAEQQEWVVGLVHHARQLAVADVDLRPGIVRRRGAGDRRALARAPLLVGAGDLGVQPVGVFRATSVGVLRKLVGDLLGRPALAGQVPDHGLKQLTALALWGAVLDQVVVVERCLRMSIVEVEPTSCLPAVAYEQRVDEGIERRQLGAWPTNLGTTDRDVARRVAVELDPGTGRAVEGELAVRLWSGHRPDDAQAPA